MKRFTIFISMLLMTVMVMATALPANAVLSGYAYTAKITFQNSDTSAYSGRIFLDMNGSGLVTGGWIQPDADDVAIEYGSQEELTTKDLEITSSVWLMDYTTVPASTSIIKWLYMGNSTATNDQVWIASGSDTMTVTDHADLDPQVEFMMNATITLINEPPGTTAYPVISKIPSSGTKTGYGLFVVGGTPTVRAEFYPVSGSPAIVSLDIAVDTEYTLSAWYISGSVTLDNGLAQSSTSMSGSVTANSEDLSLCEFDGYCDNVYFRTN